MLETKQNDFCEKPLTFFPHVDPPPAPEKYQEQKFVKTSTLMGQWPQSL